MKERIFILFSLTYLFMLPFAYGSNMNIWEKFVAEPNESSYISCQIQVKEALTDYGRNKNASTPVHKELISNIDLYNKFLLLIERGNGYAIELAFQMRPLTDGGAAEDLYVALGRITKVEPKFFLTLLDKYNLKKKEDIKHLILSYGDAFVDDIDKQIKETEERETLLRKVQDSGLLGVKRLSLELLREHKENLLQAKGYTIKAYEINTVLRNDPERALYMIKDSNITAELDLSGILLLDIPNDKTRINKIKERIKFLEDKVKKKDLLTLKSTCIKILNEEKAILLKMQGM